MTTLTDIGFDSNFNREIKEITNIDSTQTYNDSVDGSTIEVESIPHDRLEPEEDEPNFTSSTERSTGYNCTTTTYVDLPNSTKNISVTKNTLVLFFVNSSIQLVESAGNTGTGVMFIDINGSKTNQGSIFCYTGSTPGRENKYLIYSTILKTGVHTVKLVAKLETISAGAPAFYIGETWFTHILLMK